MPPYQHCTCGMVYGACICAGGDAGETAFSILFPGMGGEQRQHSGDSYNSSYNGSYSSASPPSSYSTDSGAVDCTLSLGTPSTRASPRQGFTNRESSGDHHAGAGGNAQSRRCANCGTSSTPLWRNGPRGSKSLCNACGIRYKKEERRAAATVTAIPPPTAYGYQQPWGCYGQQSRSATPVTVYGDNASAGDDVGTYLPWRLNVIPSPAPAFTVADHRTSLSFHYY